MRHSIILGAGLALTVLWSGCPETTSSSSQVHVRYAPRWRPRVRRPPSGPVIRFDKRSIRRIAVFNRNARESSKIILRHLSRRYSAFELPVARWSYREVLTRAAQQGADVVLVVYRPSKARRFGKRWAPDRMVRGGIVCTGTGIYKYCRRETNRILSNRYTFRVSQTLRYDVYSVRKRIPVQTDEVKVTGSFRGKGVRGLAAGNIYVDARAERSAPASLLPKLLANMASRVTRGRYFTFRAGSKIAARALCLAAQDGDLGLIKQLVKLGVSPRHGYREHLGLGVFHYHFPLGYALRGGREAVVQYLLGQRARFRWKDLGNAFMSGSEKLVRLVLRWLVPDGRYRKYFQSSDGIKNISSCIGHVAYLRPTQTTAQRAHFLRLLESLLKHVSKIPLWPAVKSGDLELTKKLLQRGASPHHAAVAVEAGNLPMLKLLLQHGARLRLQGYLGKRALAGACRHLPMLRFLNGRKVSLQGLVMSGRLACLAMLHKAGVRLDQRDARGRTALHLAVRLCKPRRAKILLQANLDPNATDKAGQTPVHYAAVRRCNSVLQALAQAGGDFNRKSRRGETPVFLALRSASIVKTLLKHGAKVNLRVWGKTPLAHVHAQLAKAPRRPWFAGVHRNPRYQLEATRKVLVAAGGKR